MDDYFDDGAQFDEGGLFGDSFAEDHEHRYSKEFDGLDLDLTDGDLYGDEPSDDWDYGASEDMDDVVFSGIGRRSEGASYADAGAPKSGTVPAPAAPPNKEESPGFSNALGGWAYQAWSPLMRFTFFAWMYEQIFPSRNCPLKNHCPKCGASFKPGRRFCTQCGKLL